MVLAKFLCFVFIALAYCQEPEPNGVEPAPIEPPVEPAPVPPAPSNPPPAPAPPSPPAPPPAFLFDFFNVTNGPGPRSGAVVGTDSAFSKFYVLGGNGNTGLFENVINLPNSAYVLDLSSRSYSQIAGVNFTRTGACYAQDSSRSQIWIYGGAVEAPQNSTFLSFNLNGNSFTSLPSPPAELNVPNDEVSCVAQAGSVGQFYVLFGNTGATCSNQVAFYNGTWYAVTPAGAAPAARYGANAAFYKDAIVTFGGTCGGAYFFDVNRYNVTTNAWTADATTGNGPSGRSGAVFFIQNDDLYVFGGQTAAGPVNDAFHYDLTKFVWTNISSPAFPPALAGASSTGLLNRAIFFGGNHSGNTFSADTWQFVLQGPCQSATTCEDCTKSTSTGCGWCGACVAGDGNVAFVSGSCPDSPTSYTNDIDSCPEKFPSYAIALIVIGGVVLVGIIIFAIMKWRSGKSGDYQEIS